MKVKLKKDERIVKVGDLLLFENRKQVLIVSAMNTHYRGLFLDSFGLSESRVSIDSLIVMLESLCGKLVCVINGDNLELVEV